MSGLLEIEINSWIQFVDKIKKAVDLLLKYYKIVITTKELEGEHL